MFVHTFHTMIFNLPSGNFCPAHWRWTSVNCTLIANEGDHPEIIKLSLEDQFWKLEDNDCGQGAKCSFSGSRITRGKHNSRGLTGSMKRIVTQVMLCGAASFCLQAASTRKSMVTGLNESNKTSRIFWLAENFLLEPSALEWSSQISFLAAYVDIS